MAASGSAATRWIGAIVAAAGAGIALAGCAVLTSQTSADLIDGGSAATGIRYALPRSIVDVALWADASKATFYLVLGEPRSIADPEHRYYLQYRPHPSYDDDIAVTLNDKGLLKTVSSTSTDRTKEIILNLVKGAGGLPGLLESAALPTDATLLHQLTIDPTNPAERERAEAVFNKAVRQLAAREAAKCKKDTKGRKKDDLGEFYLDPAKAARCSELVKLARTKSHIGIKIYRATDAPRSGRGKRPDCRVGICYRPAMPFVIQQRVGKSVSETIVLLPNLSSPVEIDIERAFLVKKYQVIEFDDNGQLRKLTVSKDSELYALSTLPVEVVAAVAESLRLRVKVLDRRIDYASSTGELLKARSDLEKQRVRFESALAAAPRRSTVSGVSTVPRQSAPQARSGTQSFLKDEPVTYGQ